MEALVKEVLQKAGIVVAPAVLAAIVACVVLKCIFKDDEENCIDIIIECIKDIIGIEVKV